jgi:hypothetical protein
MKPLRSRRCCKPFSCWKCGKRKSPLSIPFWESRGLRPYFHIHVSVSDFFLPMIGPHIYCSRKGSRILEIYKSLTDNECRNWETEHYNSVLEITFSFLGIHVHIWELDIYIGFSSALHLQGRRCTCTVRNVSYIRLKLFACCGAAADVSCQSYW